MIYIACTGKVNPDSGILITVLSISLGVYHIPNDTPIRYGGFTFGLVRNDVPENFGKNAPSEFRKIAVRHVTLVSGFWSTWVFLLKIPYEMLYKCLFYFVTSLWQVWFNHKGFHSMPVYLNALNNAILRANLPPSKGNPSAYGEFLSIYTIHFTCIL